jgi:uncharacterized surface protein with fasciclin (FAS1) repeats
MRKKYLPLLAIGLVVMFIASCGGTEMQGTEEGTVVEESGQTEADLGGQASVVDDESAKNVVQVAVASPDHTTLVAAVQAAELVDVLANNGPFTVFAPVNAAFDALPEGTVETLLKPENKGQLATILKYHVAAGMYKLEYLSDGMEITQAEMSKVTMNKVDGKWTVNGANILGTVEATNGIIHVIDAVLLPPEK